MTFPGTFCPQSGEKEVDNNPGQKHFGNSELPGWRPGIFPLGRHRLTDCDLGAVLGHGNHTSLPPLFLTTVSTVGPSWVHPLLNYADRGHLLLPAPLWRFPSGSLVHLLFPAPLWRFPFVLVGRMDRAFLQCWQRSSCSFGGPLELSRPAALHQVQSGRFGFTLPPRRTPRAFTRSYGPGNITSSQSFNGTDSSPLNRTPCYACTPHNLKVKYSRKLSYLDPNAYQSAASSMLDSLLFSTCSSMNRFTMCWHIRPLFPPPP